eukprot:15460573-Alexandrium_andersonii.AAC.1
MRQGVRKPALGVRLARMALLLFAKPLSRAFAVAPLVFARGAPAPRPWAPPSPGSGSLAFGGRAL